MTDSLEHSFKTLKQTIPLLLKHKIPAIPTNYALWYTYAENQNNALQEEVQRALDEGRPFSDIYTQELYRKYVADKEELNAWQLRQNVEAMVTELSQTVLDTQNNAEGFKASMETNLRHLDKVEKEGWSMNEVMKLVRNMVKEAQLIRSSTVDFATALKAAEEEISKLKAELQKSQKDAFYDALTGLYNRRYLDSEIAAINTEKPTSLIIVDVDYFKKVNDSYGHQMGDRVLKAIAKRLQEKCKPNATPFRFGGEEFAILMHNATLAEAIHQAENIRLALEKISVVDRRTNRRITGVTASFGVAELKPGMRHSDLLEVADRQLYQAKRLGRNRVMPMSNS
ncbi:GGDEF domain-containing protein [Aliidiomarina taiwanensis]|uniref:diguanylate cyclase n=1 Tax=Aliidiomarina taiwanensis TaxID=946228 RepID=A0A432X159_9GAMM|nr:GGDEF domain-containing protein [Aliidiomarina taiwanensis]RUO39892.1 GGDEF domain-containing protein [Aliidiomarina taiwanensis]